MPQNRGNSNTPSLRLHGSYSAFIM